MACSMNVLRIMRGINFKACLSIDGRYSASWKPSQSQTRKKGRIAAATRIEVSKGEELEYE